MLLELIPPLPSLPPFRLFIDFADLSHGHANPLAWTSQLSTLLQHELDLPRSMHMLDKAVGLTTLLETVRFDLRSARSAASDGKKEGIGLTTVRCEFVDGGVVEWAIPVNFDALNLASEADQSTSTSTPFFRTLQHILKDVHGVRLEEERAKLATQHERQQRQRPGSSGNGQPLATVGPSLARRFTVSVMRHSNSMPSMVPEIPPPKAHKRQRSFLRSIASAVGSIKKMNNSGKAMLPPPPPSPTTPPPQAPPPKAVEEPLLSPASTHEARAQMYRDRLRVALLDAYRRFVLAGLASEGSSQSVFLATPASETAVEEVDEEALTSDSSSSDEDPQNSDDEQDSASPECGDQPSDGTLPVHAESRTRRPPTPTVPAGRPCKLRPRANSNATTSTSTSMADPHVSGKREVYSYYMWVLKSMLRRTEEEMENILKECEDIRKREVAAEQSTDLEEEEEAEQQRLSRVRDREQQFDQLEREARTVLGHPHGNDHPNPTLKKSPSILLKKRSEPNLIGPGVPLVGSVSRFSFGQFIKRKPKQAPTVDSGKPPSRIPRLTSRPSFPPPSRSSFGTLSPRSPPLIRSHPVPNPVARRLVHFAPVADSNEFVGNPDVQNVQSDSGRFSPTTMDVPHLFSDSDSDEGDTPLEGLSESERGSRTSTISASSSTTDSSGSEGGDTDATVETAPTTPSSSPPLSTITCDFDEVRVAYDTIQEEEEEALLPDGSTQEEEVAQEGEELIECGYAVTCDRAVVVGDDVPVVELQLPQADTMERGAGSPSTSLEPPSNSAISTLAEPDTPTAASNPPTRPTKPFILPTSYTRLLDLTHKLRSLLIHATLSTQAIKEEEERNLELLEVRGRRRAWSGGAFVRGVSAVRQLADDDADRKRQEVLASARGRADEKRREWRAKVKEERRMERRNRRRKEHADSDEDIPSPGVALVNTNRKLPPIPYLALSLPSHSSPLALYSYTAEDKEEQEGLVYECPVKEETVFYTFSKGRQEHEEGRSPASSRRGRLSMDALDRSVMSSRELRVRKSHGLDMDDGFMEFAGGMVDENGFVYAHDFARFHDPERSAHGFPLLDALDQDEDDGIEWQNACLEYRARSISPPPSPTSMDAIIPPRPRLLPTKNHPSPTRLLSLSEDEDSDGESSPVSSGKGGLAASSALESEDEEDEFEFDRMRLTGERLEEDEGDDEDDDDEFYADISHITHFVDGLDRRTKERQPRRASSGESSVYHRQRKRASAGSLLEVTDEEPPSPSLSDGEDAPQSLPDRQFAKRARNHRRQWHALALDASSGEVKHHENACSQSSPLSPVEEHSDASAGRGLRISLEAERPTPIGSGRLKIRPRDRTKSMYKRLSPISRGSNGPPSPILARRTVSMPLPEKVPTDDEVFDIAPPPYVPYGRMDFGTSPSTPLTDESLLCQPVRFSRPPASLGGYQQGQGISPTVKLVTKNLAASPPPPHPSPPIFTPFAPRLRISVKSKECERVLEPDVPRSPSPPRSRSPSPPLSRPLSPASSLDGSLMLASTQSSAGPPIDDSAPHPSVLSSLADGTGEEFTLAMDIRDRKIHSHQQQARKQIALKKMDDTRAYPRNLQMSSPIATSPPVRGTTTTKSAMRRRGVDLGFLESSAPANGTLVQ